MKERQFTTTVLTPDEGMVLTQSADVHISERVFASEISIGENNSPSEWMEINEARRQEYAAERAAYNLELEKALQSQQGAIPAETVNTDNNITSE